MLILEIIIMDKRSYLSQPAKLPNIIINEFIWICCFNQIYFLHYFMTYFPTYE